MPDAVAAAPSAESLLRWLHRQPHRVVGDDGSYYLPGATFQAAAGPHTTLTAAVSAAMAITGEADAAPPLPAGGHATDALEREVLIVRIGDASMYSDMEMVERRVVKRLLDRDAAPAG